MSTEATEVFSGKPPKTSARIRSVLKHVHGANADAASDLPSGNAHDDVCVWVSAAEFHWRTLADRFASTLARRQIPAQIVKRGRHWFVEVLSVHLHEAVDLFATHRQELKHSSVRNQHEARQFNNTAMAAWIFLGLVIAFLAGGTAMSVVAILPKAAAMGRGFLVMAALLGGLGGIFAWFGFVWMMLHVRQR